MNRRTFITSLLATTAAIPLARVAPVEMRYTSYGAGVGMVYDAEVLYGVVPLEWFDDLRSIVYEDRK